VSLATGVWLANVAFLICGTSTFRTFRRPNLSLTMWFLIPGAARVNGPTPDILILLAHLASYHLQIRSSVVDSRCAIGNIQSNKPTFISILVAYIVLLLIMLVGLFRLRSPGVGWLDLGRRLWKQVRVAGRLFLILLRKGGRRDPLLLMRFPSKRVSFGSCLRPSPNSYRWYVQSALPLYVSSRSTPLNECHDLRRSCVWI
jgi:hypothetical protein